MDKFDRADLEANHFEQLYPADTRFEEVKKVIEIIRSGKAAQVIGFPGVGKGNILRLLPYNRKVREAHLGADESIFHFVFMDFSEVRERNLSDIIKFIFISLSYSLGERKLQTEQDTINEFLKEALEFNDELILFQGLKKSVDFLALEKGLKLVFLFDRFEDYIPNIDTDFFLNLRILRNRAKYSFQTVFAVRRPIEDILEPALFGEFYEFIVGNHVFIPLKDTPGLDFRFAYIEQITGKKTDDKTKSEIEKLTGGHVKLAKLSYEVVLAEDGTKNIEELLMSKPQITGALWEIWNYLTPLEQDDVKNADPNEFLEKINLYSDGKLNIPLLKTYANSLPSTAFETKISYDPERNEIIKNGQSLTERLTPSEFRLLKFLITNKDKLCEKDEIIQNVWRDTQTREGVTDQALDQIVYRLRKKIEMDPNNPKFIQTIKGRGYKFNE